MTTDAIELKPGEYAFRDPKTLQPHPISASLYLDRREDNQLFTPMEAANEIMEKMDVNDILDNVGQRGILVPLVINKDGIIISGSRRWKAARLLQLTNVPVEVKTFLNETEEKRAILDYNRTRTKTESQKMREADLYKEIISKLAAERMLDGKRNPVPNLAQGSKHQRKTNTIVSALLGMGKETFRKEDYIWQRAKSGDPKAVTIMQKLDEKTTSIDPAFNILKKADKGLALPQLSRWQKGEPVGPGHIWTCPECGCQLEIFHLKNGRHRHMESAV